MAHNESSTSNSYIFKFDAVSVVLIKNVLANTYIDVDWMYNNYHIIIGNAIFWFNGSPCNIIFCIRSPTIMVLLTLITEGNRQLIIFKLPTLFLIAEPDALFHCLDFYFQENGVSLEMQLH